MAHVMRPLGLILACLATSACATQAVPISQGPLPTDVSPPLSFCIGRTTHCVLPDLGTSAVNYDLQKKRWDAGVASLGVGYALLFWSDRPWAPGIAMHASGQWGQAGSHLDLVPTVVVLRYLHAGATYRLADGGGGWRLTLGAGAPLDLLSGRTMRERLADARVAAMLREARQ